MSTTKELKLAIKRTLVYQDGSIAFITKEVPENPARNGNKGSAFVIKANRVRSMLAANGFTSVPELIIYINKPGEHMIEIAAEFRKVGGEYVDKSTGAINHYTGSKQADGSYVNYWSTQVTKIVLGKTASDALARNLTAAGFAAMYGEHAETTAVKNQPAQTEQEEEEEEVAAKQTEGKAKAKAKA